MAEIVLLQTENREGRGTRLSEKLRKLGKVPAVVYGHKEKTLSVSVEHDLLLSAVRHGARIVEVRARRQGREGPDHGIAVGLPRQGRPARRFQARQRRRAHRDHRARRTQAASPRASPAGGVLDQPLHTLRIECPVLAVPETIRVNIDELQIDAAIHVRELKLPEGVKVLDEADAIVVHVKTAGRRRGGRGRGRGHGRAGDHHRGRRRDEETEEK